MSNSDEIWKFLEEICDKDFDMTMWEIDLEGYGAKLIAEDLKDENIRLTIINYRWSEFYYDKDLDIVNVDKNKYFDDKKEHIQLDIIVNKKIFIYHFYIELLYIFDKNVYRKNISIYVKIPEFGLYIKNGDNRKKQFLGDLCHLYSNKIPNKIIKSEIFRDEITSIPTNVLAYSDYTLFINDIKSYFEKILNTGYCRRFVINFQEKIKLSSTYLSDEEERQIYEKLEQLGATLFQLFKKVDEKSCYILSAEAKYILNQYKIKNNNLYNQEENSLLQREINSRELKALKLSCLFAILNHPEELVIDSKDIEQAILAVDFLSQDFKKFLKYKPTKNDRYQEIFKY